VSSLDFKRIASTVFTSFLPSMMLRPYTTRFALVFAVLGLGFTATRGQEVLDGIAAEVASGGMKEVVTFSQVRDLVGPKEKQAHDTLKGNELVEKIKEIRLAAINDLIDRTLIIQDFKTKGFTIPEYFIDEHVQTLIKDEFGGDRQAFLRTLAAQGFTLEKFRDMQRDIIIVQEMRKQAVKGVSAISDSRINEYYKDHTEEYSQPEQIKLRMIVIHGVDNEARHKMILEIRQKIVDGAEFGDLARMYSEDSTQENYGDWGWVDKKKLNESLTKTAFNLKPGEISQVIELGDSYYLLYCEAKKAQAVKPLKDMRDEIEKALLQTDRQQQQQDWLQKLRRKAYIKMY
jgi:parvulin-like peptidyl-prolyl isomerase